MPYRNRTPQLLGNRGEPLGKQVRIPGLVAEKTQAAGDLALHQTQCRFDADASCGIQDLVGHAIGIEDSRVLTDSVELLLRAEELEQPLLPMIIGDAGLLPQLAQAIPAVFGKS